MNEANNGTLPKTVVIIAVVVVVAIIAESKDQTPGQLAITNKIKYEQIFLQRLTFS